MKRAVFMRFLALALLCGGFSAPAGAAQFPLEIDLANPFNSRSVKVLGDSVDSRAGTAIAVGDLNGDGSKDLIVGSPVAMGGKGVTTVIFGVPAIAPGDSVDLRASQSGILRIIGKSALDWSGSSVACGDVNGDGYDDLVIGAYKGDPGVDRDNAGEVYVIFGFSTIQNIGTIDLGGSPSLPVKVLRIYGDRKDDWFGYSVAVGALNSDTKKDIIIGAIHADPRGRTDAGETCIVFGASSLSNPGFSIDFHAPPAGVARISGEADADYSGYAVAVGDMDNNSIDDLLIGSPNGFNRKGAVYFIPGGALMDTLRSFDLAVENPKIVRLYVGVPGDGAGSSLAVGDMNGDGYRDLLIGAPGGDPAGRADAGEIWVVLGGPGFRQLGTVQLGVTPGVTPVRIKGGSPSGKSGSAVSSGDINGDLRDDLLIGTPFSSPRGRVEAGSAQVVYGGDSFGDQANVDLADTLAFSRISGARAGDLAGSAVLLADTNGDGYPDPIIGAPYLDPAGRTDAGGAWIVRGFGTGEVISFTPGVNAFVSTNTRVITAVFSVDMGSATVVLTENGIRTVPGTLVMTGVNSLRYVPLQPLNPGANMRAVINGTDRFGAPITQKQWDFEVKTDETPPRLVSRLPGNGAVNVSPSDSIVVKFSGDADTDSTTVTLIGNNNRAIALTKSWTDSTVTISSTTPFLLGETVTVLINAGDRYGDRASYSWSFTVRPETTPPTYVLLDPSNPRFLSRRGIISIRFPADIDTSTVTARIEGNLTGDITGTWSWTDSTYTFRRPQEFLSGETIKLTVNAADIRGNTATGQFTVFTVRPDDTPPAIVSRAPAPGESNVATNAAIVMAFTEDAVSDSTTVTVTSRVQGALTVTKTWQANNTLTVNHSGSFGLGDSITVRVSACDAYTNRQIITWVFHVRPETDPPNFALTSPRLPALTGWNEPVALAFPADVDTLTVRASLRGSLGEDIAGVWRWSGAIYTFTPSADYTPGAILTLIVNAADIHKNAIPETTRTFTVRSDGTPPGIVSRTPAVNAVNVAPNQAVIVSFTADAVSDSTTAAVSSDRRGALSFTRSWAINTLTLALQSAFQANEIITVTVNAGDVYANRKTYVWKFTAGSRVPPPYSITTAGNPNLLTTHQPIAIGFQGTMDLSSATLTVTGSLSGEVAGSRTWSGALLTFIPSPGYRPGETISVLVRGSDVYGNPIPEETTTFHVRSDETPPSIVFRSPAAGEGNVLPDRSILIVFSADAARDSTTVRVTGQGGRVIALTPSWSDSTLILSGAGAFRLGEVVAVTVNAGDVWSNRMTASWSFTIRPETTPPSFTVRTLSGASLLRSTDTIALVFPADIDTATVRAVIEGSSSGSVAGSWTWSDSTRTFTPSPGYRPGETLTLTVNAADIHLNAIPETKKTFRVKLDDIPPSIIARSPAPGAVNVLPDEPVVIVFSQDTVKDSTTVTVTGGDGRLVSMTRSWTDSTLTLNGAFRLGDTVAVAVSAADVDGNRMTSVWSFAVRKDVTPPAFETIPSGDPANLAADAPVTFLFPADVDTATVRIATVGSVSGAFAGRFTWLGTALTFEPLALYRLGESLTFTVSAVDTLGNVLPEAKRTFTVGEHTPRLAMTSVTAADSAGRSFRIRFTVSDPDGNSTVTRGWQYSIGGGAWAAVDAASVSGNIDRLPGAGDILWTVPSAFTGVYSRDVRFRMEVFDGRYGSGLRVSPAFLVDWNRAPSVTVRSAAPDYKTGKLTVGFTVADTERNTISLLFEYSADGGATWKTGASDRDLSRIDPAGYEGSFGWKLTDGIPRGVDNPNVKIRLTAVDFKPGAPGVFGPFRIDLNDPPSLVLGDLFTTQSGDVPINWRIADAEKDTVKIVCAYSTDDGKTWVATSSVSGADTLAAPEGTLVWHSKRDLPAIHSFTVRFRGVPWDRDVGAGDDTGSFQLFNNGQPLLTAAALPDTVGRAVTFVVNVSDPEKDTAEIHTSWSKDGIVWKPASISGDTLRATTVAGPDTLVWNAEADLGRGLFPGVRLRITASDASNPFGSPDLKALLLSSTVDNAPPALVSVSGFAGSDTVRVRFDERLDESSALDTAKYALSGGLLVKKVISGNPRDRLSLILQGGVLPLGETTLTIRGISDRFGNAAALLSRVFRPDDGNANPSVKIDPFPALVKGDATVRYKVSDAEGDTVSLIAEFSLDGGASWRTATTGTPLTGIVRAVYTGAFIWKSAADLKGRDVSGVLFRVTAKDTEEGEPSSAGPFRVDDNEPPTARFRLSGADSVRAGIVELPYTLSDAEGDTLSLEMSFSADGGGIWRPASVSGVVEGIRPARYEGLLRWNSTADLPDFTGTVRLRLVARDHDPGPADSVSVKMDNFGASSVVIVLPGGEIRTDIPVDYTIADKRMRPVSLRFSFSRDGGRTWKNPTIEGSTSNILPAAYSGALVWRSTVDLAGYEGMALLRAVPNNGIDGFPVSAEARVDYNAPPAVTFGTIPAKISGDAAIPFTVTDAERDTVSVTLQYSIDGAKTWYLAAIAGATGGIPSDGSLRTILWKSMLDLPGRDFPDVRLRMAAADADTGAFVISGSFRLDDNLPPTVLLTPVPPDSVSEDTVDIGYRLSDAERNMLAFDVQYSLDGGIRYSPASVTGKTSQIFSDSYAGSFRWNISIDLPGKAGTAIMKVIPRDTDPGPPDSLVVRFNTFGICRVVLTAPQGEQTGDVSVGYEITDRKNNPVSLALTVSVDGGGTWSTATLDGSVTGIPPARYRGSFVWKSRETLAGFDGVALVRAVPNNGAGGVPDTVAVSVDYNSPPAVLSVKPQDAILTGNAAMILDLSDAEGDPVGVAVSYSLDGGATWRSAAVQQNTGILPGAGRTVVWSTFADMGYAYERTVHLRFRPADKDSGAVFTAGPFTVTNIVGDFNFDRTVDGFDLPGFSKAWKAKDLSHETGPAAGVPPALTVHPDGRFDLEDLAVFVMMWNRFLPEKAAKTASETDAPPSGALNAFDSPIRFVSSGDGVVQVISRGPVDFLRLMVSMENAGGSGVSFSGGGWWNLGNGGLVLTRALPGGRFEAAAVLLEDRAGYAGGDDSPVTLGIGVPGLAKQERGVGTLRFGALAGDVRIRYHWSESPDGPVQEGETALAAAEVNPRPVTFRLMQNTPNPFNTGTVIRYELPQDARVLITIRTVTGQKAAVLEDRFVPAGRHDVRWDASGFPSGVYFCTCRAGRFEETRRMMLLK